MQHGFMDGGVGRQASGSSTGFGQGPDYADFYGPFPQVLTGPIAQADASNCPPLPSFLVPLSLAFMLYSS